MATKILLSKDKKQYKANLHSHSNLSDGKLSPTEMKELYKANGYDILAITDHCDINGEVEGIYDVYDSDAAYEEIMAVDRLYEPKA